MDHPVIDDKAPNPRLIFCINSGRAGSNYLHHLLDTAKGVSAFHERPPAMSHQYLAMAMEKGLARTMNHRRIKIEAIRKIMARQPPGQIYAESNHMFIKTFYDVVMEAFPHESITVVILRRDLAKVLKSFINLGYFSERNRECLHWMHRVPSSLSLTCTPRPHEEMDMYDRSISYLIDIEAQALAFKQKHPFCRVQEVVLDELQSVESVQRFLERLNLEATPRTAATVGVRVNERQSRKDVIKIETSEEYCRERIATYLDRCRAQGLVLPNLPQFKEATAENTGDLDRPNGFFQRITAPFRKVRTLARQKSSVAIPPPVPTMPDMDTETVVVTKPSLPSRGFFSLVSHALSNLYDLRDKYSRFYFDYSENRLYRDHRYGEENYFNNYFEQDKNLLAAPKKQVIDSATDWNLRRDAWHHIAGADRYELSGILHRHIKIKEHILAKADAIRRDKFKGRSVLGVHKRGTDHHVHGELLDINYYFSVVDQHLDQYDCLYLATDESATLQSFKARYKDKLIFVEDFFRSNDANSIHGHNFFDNYKKGEDVLIESLLLSQVDLLLKTRSHVTLFSVLYNKDLPHQHIDTHIQYH